MAIAVTRYRSLPLALLAGALLFAVPLFVQFSMVPPMPSPFEVLLPQTPPT